ncbi:hypothetical protein Tco_0294803 [Tanacetum coccineum]
MFYSYDQKWKEILKEKGLPLDQVYELLDKDTVPLKVLSRRESDEWVGQQRSILGDDGYEEMMNKKFKTYEKYMMAVDVMDKMMLKKKAGKEEEVKKIAGRSGGFCADSLQQQEEEQGEEEEEDVTEMMMTTTTRRNEMMKKATTSSSL